MQRRKDSREFKLEVETSFMERGVSAPPASRDLGVHRPAGPVRIRIRSRTNVAQTRQSPGNRAGLVAAVEFEFEQAVPGIAACAG